MAQLTNVDDLIEYCLRSLGKPVININVDTSQCEDRIDEALQEFQDKHFDAVENSWVYYELTQTDIDNGYLTLPPEYLSVTSILPFSKIFSSSDIFSVEYQLAMNSLHAWTPFDEVDYFMKMSNLRSVQNTLSVTPTIEFTKHLSKLKIHASLQSLGVGYKIALNVVKAIDIDSLVNDMWLKKYSTALIKRQWGANLKKFSGVQLLGGVELNGQEIYNEAVEEIKELEDELEETYMLPTDFFLG